MHTLHLCSLLMPAFVFALVSGLGACSSSSKESPNVSSIPECAKNASDIAFVARAPDLSSNPCVLHESKVSHNLGVKCTSLHPQPKNSGGPQEISGSYLHEMKDIHKHSHHSILINVSLTHRFPRRSCILSLCPPILDRHPHIQRDSTAFSSPPKLLRPPQASAPIAQAMAERRCRLRRNRRREATRKAGR